jgi:hypothetical protein
MNRRSLKSYSSIAVISLILAAGIAASLAIHSPPSVYAIGWSKAQPINSVDCNSPYKAVISGQDRIHLVWQQEKGTKQVFYAQINFQGDFIVEPTRLSHQGLEATKPSMILTNDDTALLIWIERDDVSHRLLIGRADDVPRVLATTTTFMEGAALSSDGAGNVYVVWINRRQGNYEVNLAKMDSREKVVFTDRLLTASPVFKYEPTIVANRDRLHMLYFEDNGFSRQLIHHMYHPSGEPATEPKLIISGKSRGEDIPLAIDSDDKGNLYLFGAKWDKAFFTKIDSWGQEIAPLKPVLTDVLDYSQMSLATDGGWLEFIWTATKRYKPQLQVFHIRFDTLGNAVSQMTRLTYSHTSAWKPLILTDGGQGKHLFWQQHTDEQTCSLMYMNDIDPAPLSYWRRLGFSGQNGWLNLLYALGASLLVTVVAMAINAGKLLIVGAAVVILALGVAKPLNLKSPWVPFALVVVVFAVTIHPISGLLGQSPVDIDQATHWVLFSTATLVVLYATWTWPIEPSNALAWGGISLSWIYIYYYINTVLFLREVFAP